MSTAQERVNSALELLGATSPIKVASPEVINKTFDVLVSMLELWNSQSIGITGLTLPTDIGDELNEPPQVQLAIDFNLAITAAPYIRKIPTAETRMKAKSTMQQLRNQFSPKPTTIFPDVLPVGSGNKSQPLGQTFYPDQETVDSESGVPITS